MWLLISERGESFLITPNEEHIISRRGGSITLSDDQSISRQHAKILLDNNDSNCDCGIVLTDASSKYGTFVNDGIETATRISQNDKIILKHNDVVRFGLQWNKWKVVFMPLVVLTSTLKQPEKQLVRSQIETLGGKLLSNWSPQCTHLTMNQITLTVKVVSALGAGQNIVTPKYWQNLLLSVQTKQAIFPDPSDYIPPLNEATLNENEISFRVNKKRSTLFESLLFVSNSVKQKSRIEPMVTAAGGKVVNFEDCSLSKDGFCKEGVILMQPSFLGSPGSEQSQVPDGYNIISKYLTSRGLRCIPESDIGLGILYCSREKFCNPRYSAQSVFECRPAPLQQTESVPVLAKDTQENSPAQPLYTGKIINETAACGVSQISGRASKKLQNNTNEDKEEKTLSEVSAINKVHESVLQETVMNKKGNCVPKTVVDNIFYSDNEKSKNHQKTNPRKNRLTNNDLSDEEDYRFSKSSDTNKKSKKRMIISDDENDDNEEEFRFPSQKKRTCSNNIKSNNESKLKNKDEQINKKTDKVVISDSDSEGERFSLPIEKKKKTKVPSCLIDSEQDMFVSSNKIDDELNVNKNNKPPTSLDMFASFRSLSSNRKEHVNELSTSLTVVSKRSMDIFDTSDIFCKKPRNTNDNDDVDCDFEFNDTRPSCKNLDDVLGEDNIFKTPKSVVNNEDNNLLSYKTLANNPFQSNKLSRDIFEVGSSGLSENRGVKRRTSIEEPPSKKPSLINNVVDSDDSNEIREISSYQKSPENVVVKTKIKQEPADFTIRDPELHDSTLVFVKSLIVSLRGVNVSNKSDNNRKTNSTNFKKFRKATCLKMPEFIDLVPYKDTNNESRWIDGSAARSDDSSDEVDDGWAFQQSQTVKKTKSKSRKVL